MSEQRTPWIVVQGFSKDRETDYVVDEIISLTREEANQAPKHCIVPALNEDVSRSAVKKAKQHLLAKREVALNATSQVASLQSALDDYKARQALRIQEARITEASAQDDFQRACAAFDQQMAVLGVSFRSSDLDPAPGTEPKAAT
mgnify:CR=1 FL=1